MNFIIALQVPSLIELLMRGKRGSSQICINHPDRKMQARGMCASCYNTWHLQQSPERMAAKTAANLEWRKNHREHFKAYLKKNADHIRERQHYYRAHLNYGIIREELDALKNLSQGKCAICKKHKSRLNIDHCHATGKVGLLLCTPCNYLVACIENSDDVLAAYAYVKKYRPHFSPSKVAK